MIRLVLGLLLLGLALGAAAQRPNDSLYQQLLHQYLAEHRGPYAAVEGVAPEWLPDSLEIDTSATLRLTVLAAEVSYQPLAQQRYLRKIAIPLQREDSLLRSSSLSLSDTLSRRELRWVLRHSSLALQGEDPRRFSRWGRPALLLGGTAVITVFLFVWRSR